MWDCCLRSQEISRNILVKLNIKQDRLTHLCIIGHPEHQSLLEEYAEGVDVVTGEVEHDPPGHEGVAALSLPGEKREPDPHTCSPTVEPEGQGEVRLGVVGLSG